MPFLDHVLQQPSYGWKDEQQVLIKPTAKQIFREFFSRLNIFKTRKNWLLLFSWLKVAILSAFFVLFLVNYLHWWTLLAAFAYGMIIKPHQIDLAWYYIKFMNWLGAVSHYKDNKKQFYERHYIPFKLHKSRNDKVFKCLSNAPGAASPIKIAPPSHHHGRGEVPAE